jgi:uncharacterized protein
MSKSIFLAAEWRHLCLLNYEVDPSLLISHLPYGTELDFHEGKTYVSLVAFMFYRTKMFGKIPAFFHGTFEEINLRFYVVRQDNGVTKRGVVFIKEVVPKPILAWLARHFYKENYVSMETANLIEQGKSYEYRWGENSLNVKANGKVLHAEPGTAERWITEHYWGYTQVSAKKTFEYEVKHPIWDLWGVESHNLTADIEALYGKKFESTFTRQPNSVFLANGSDVTVHFPIAII